MTKQQVLKAGKLLVIVLVAKAVFKKFHNV